MANTFEEQAQGRFGKANAFLTKAQTLLQDDLVARTVLADAVSAIKNALQGFLLVKVSRTPNESRTQYWQEVAVSNRMPDLINACIDAGLDIRHLARDVRRLNDDRNYRTHDDPHARIDADQARRALNLARDVAQRVNAAVKGRSAVAVPAPLPNGSGNGRVPAHNGTQNGRAAGSAAYESAAERRSTPAATITREVEPAPAATPAASEAATPATDDDAIPATDDTGIYTTLTPLRSRRRSALARGAVAAALVVSGAAAGLGLAVPLARGSLPGWLSFAHSWYAVPGAHAAPITAPAAKATPLVPSSAPQSAGYLMASAPVCQTGKVALQIQNTGHTPLAWAAGGSARDEAVTFALSTTATPQPSALGTLAAGAKTTLYAVSVARGPYRIVLVGPSGTLEVIAPAC